MTFALLISGASILITCLMSYTLIILIRRSRMTIYRQEKRDKFSEIIALEICDFISGTPHPFNASRLDRFEKEIFQQQILESIRSMNGSERDYLVGRYKELGFMDADLSRCSSLRWENRLLGIVHLGYLEQNDLAPLFMEMIGDRLPIVSSAAALAFTSLDHAVDGETLFERLPPSIFERKDVLSEIMFRISAKDAAFVLKKILDPYSSALLRECCIRAILREHTIDIVPVLTKFLDQSGMEPRSSNTGNIALAIAGLRSIGDPTACTSVRRYLRHPLPKIRGLAIQMLTEMADPESEQIIAELEKDSSIEVQRAIPRRAAS